VRMNAQHPAKVTPSWYGDSDGHYEGDTLVIDTVGIKVGRYSMVDWYGTPHSEALHVIERYRLISYEEAQEGYARDAKENGRNQQAFDPDYRGKVLQLLFTVDDPNVFTAPWSATVTYRHMTQDQWVENVCAENPRKYGTEEDAQVPTATAFDALGSAAMRRAAAPMIASGTRIMAIVLNWRRRYAEAPSWIALAISFIFGVPSSCAMTFFAKRRPTTMATRAAPPERNSTAHSPPLRMKSW